MKHNLVLEIGAGHNPSPSADVVVDKYLYDDTERGGPLRITRPTVVADGECLPFRNGTFARSIGRQVMEHMQDIGQFFEELMRVSSAGYLAAPSHLREHAFGWSYHRWLITVQDDVLLCAKKPESQTPPHGMLMHYFAATNKEFKRFLRTLPTGLLHVQYPWSGKINYRIVDALEFPNFSSYERIEAYLQEKTATAGQRQKIKAWILRNSPEWLGAGISRMRQTYHDLRRRKSRRQVDLKSLLACPVCKVSLLHEKQRCVCSQCDRHYPIVDGIPVFLLDESLCPTSRIPQAA